MSSFQHPNPSHGTKNTTDPTAQSEPKLEHSGTVLKDSLAAESIESGGSFSKGNPTGVSGVTAASSTVNRGDDTEGFRMVHGSDDKSNGSGRKQDDGSDEVGYKPMKSGKSAGMKMQSNTEYDLNAVNERAAEAKASDKHDKQEWNFPAKNHVQVPPEVGSAEDPGRYAEQKFAERNARVDNILGTSGVKGDGDMKNPYDALDSERSV